MSVRIRLTGTAEEIAPVREALLVMLDVIDVSGFYPKRRKGRLRRQYLTAASAHPITPDNKVEQIGRWHINDTTTPSDTAPAQQQPAGTAPADLDEGSA